MNISNLIEAIHELSFSHGVTDTVTGAILRVTEGYCLRPISPPRGESIKVSEDNVQIIYKHNKPYGIRDSTGFLFFFTEVSKFSNQEERYREEVEQQFKLADFLLSAIKSKGVEG